MKMTACEEQIAQDWCKDNHDDLLQMVINELGSINALKECDADILVSDVFDDTYLFYDEAEFLSNVGYSGPSEVHELKMFAAGYLINFIEKGSRQLQMSQRGVA